jgi:hypothetical protein
VSNIVTISGVTSTVISYKDQPVCTTQQLAQFFGCDSENILDNHRKNPERFEDGKHYVFLDGETLRAFKEGLPENIREPLKFAPKVMLWTERGAARHAKALTTDKAWEVFEQMEDVYFQAAAIARAAPTRPHTLSRNQVVASILLLRSAAEDLKFAPSAVLGGYQKLEAQLGVAGLLPSYAVDAPTSASGGSSEETKSAAELLLQHGAGLSAIAFNRLLTERGYLEERERPSSKGGTKKFKVCVAPEFGKNLTSPNNPRETQPHWYVSRFAELLDLVLRPKPAAA